MSEHQNIEYKANWYDDCLKWICGFANANGGTLYIGKDDKGSAVDVADYKKLMEDLPNKIRDVLGVMAEVNLLHDSDGQITNKKYVAVAAVSSRQALIDLKELVEKKVLDLVGKGSSARYSLHK